MCDNLAKYRFTWPGQDESVICDYHVVQLLTLAGAMDLHLQIIPLSKEDLEVGLTCNQKDG